RRPRQPATHRPDAGFETTPFVLLTCCGNPPARVGEPLILLAGACSAILRGPPIDVSAHCPHPAGSSVSRGVPGRLRAMVRLAAAAFVIVMPALAFAADRGIAEQMHRFIAKQEVAGTVTIVVSRDKVLDLQAVGQADVANGAPMKADT